MLRFCDTKIYLDTEICDDLCDEVWMTSYPAGSEGVYDGLKVHIFDASDMNSLTFFDDKAVVGLAWQELLNFVTFWYRGCIKRWLIRPKRVEYFALMNNWFTSYLRCYVETLGKINNFDNALSYYEALTLACVSNPAWHDGGVGYPIKCPILREIEYQVVPELSWMLLDYRINDGETIWKDTLTEVVRHNCMMMKYKKSLLEAQGSVSVNIPVFIDNPNITIDDIDLTDKDSLAYFSNPFDTEFSTNFVYIRDYLLVDDLRIL